MAYEQIEQVVMELGRGIAEEAVVIGSSAITLAMPEFRRPNDVDVAVSSEAFAYLLRQPGWEASQSADGTPRLLKDALDVGVGWGDNANYPDLLARSWTMASGLHVAGLPDVYAYKHRRRQQADAADLQAVQAHLQNPNRSPFSARHIPHELAAAWDCLPAELRDHPDAERAAILAANGMHTVYTLYGHPGIGQTNQIVGELEQPEFGVPATYHNGFGLVRDAKALQRHLAIANAPADDCLLALAVDPYTDAVYGNGRFSNNPQGHDELRSANLVRGHALQLGFTPEEAERTHTVTLATTFDQRTGSQRGKHVIDPLARAVAGVDLYLLTEPGSVAASFALAIEDEFSVRASATRTIGKVLVANGVRIYSILDGLRSIDRYANERPADAPEGPTVRQAFAARLAGNATFHRQHQYPDGWTLDNPRMREEHAQVLERISTDLLAGKTVMEAYVTDVRAHTARMGSTWHD